MIRQIGKRGINIGLSMFGQGFEKLGELDGIPVDPGLYRAFPDGKLRIGNNQIRIKFGGGAQTVAFGAGALGGIK